MATLINFFRQLLPSHYFKYLQIIFYSLRNELLYLETHITDHCNLNCRACRHFSPISGESFRDLKLFAKDMKRMQELFSNIGIIRLMGGEPLLHPEVADFLLVTREAFPRAEIHLVTNGVLLPQMKDAFWESCAKCKVILDVTRYPINLNLEKIRELSRKNRVVLFESPLVTKFHQYHMNRKGDSDTEETFNACRQVSYCPFLDSTKGRLYLCPVSASVEIYSKHFNDEIAVSDKDYISIYGKVTSRDIFRFLNRSIPFCGYCTTKKTLFDWTRSRLVKEEWFG